MNYCEGVLFGLDRTERALQKALEGLSQQEVAWRPCAECNSIGAMVIHLGRVEDTWVHRIVGGKDIWEIDGWASKFGLPANDRGWTFDTQSSGEQRLLKELLEYYGATHQLLVKTIETIPESRFAEIPDNPLNFTVEQIFAHIVVEENQHVGQIDYLKGLQENSS